MPRGVYDRSKVKTATAPVAKTAAPKAKAATKTSAPKAEKSEMKASAPVNAKETADLVVGFNILQSSIQTLAGSLGISSIEGGIRKALNHELIETVETLKALRLSVFGHLLEQPETATEGATEASAPVPPPAAMAPPAPTLNSIPQIPQSGGLPQGNASFQPPAPPALPHH